MILTPEKKKPIPKCVHCRCEMESKKIVKKSTAGQLAGVLFGLLGFCLLFVFPLGTIPGIIILVIACKLGYEKKQGWLCPACKYSFTVD